MTISTDALIVLIGVYGAIQVTRATYAYRKAVRQPAQRAADRKTAKETGNAS